MANKVSVPKDFNDLIAKKISGNTRKVKISFKNLLGKEKFQEIQEAAQKLKDKTNPSADTFHKV